jgi:hypothetical protein
MKKHLCIQLHLSPSVTGERAQELLVYILNATFPAMLASFERGTEDGISYVTMNFAIEDVSLLWNLVKTQLDVRNLRSAAIVTCEGSNGWDDYLLLHSFDPDEEIDELARRK